jgi:hypothetical protein
MNEEENPSEAQNCQCSIHNIMPTGLQHAPVDFWDGVVHEESSVESSDEQEDSARTGAINFSGSNEFVGSFDNLEVDSPLVFADTKELSAEEKLKIVFDLPEIEKYYKEFACWLVRSVLLKGYLYVTEKHMCLNCGADVKFKGTINKGYSDYCSLDCANDSGDLLNRQKESIKKKYGVESTNQLDSVKNKKKESFLDKYGVDNPMKNESIKTKRLESIKKKYGVDNVTF